MGVDHDHINNWDPRWCQNLSPTAANPHNFSEKYSAEKPLPPINMHGLLNLRTDPAMVVCIMQLYSYGTTRTQKFAQWVLLTRFNLAFPHRNLITQEWKGQKKIKKLGRRQNQKSSRNPSQDVNILTQGGKKSLKAIMSHGPMAR